MSRSVGRVPAPDDWRHAAQAGTDLRKAAAASVRTTPIASAALPAPILAELIGWAQAGAPNEACGLLAGDRSAREGGRPTRFLPLRNAAASPYRYYIDSQDLYGAMLDIDDADEVVWGIFHSHVASAAEPSVTDIGLAFYPDSLYLICSLDGEPHVRAWTIVDGAVAEAPLVIEQ